MVKQTTATQTKRYTRPLIAGISCAVFIVLLCGYVFGWAYCVDWPLAYAFASLHAPALTSVALNIATLTEPAVLIFIVVALSSVSRFRNTFWLFAIDIGGIAIINYILKYVFLSRPRPFMQDPSLFVTTETGSSYPSGHMLIAVALFGLLFYLVYAYINKSVQRTVWCTVFVVLIVIVGLSRLYLNVHFLTDIIGGACVSLIWLCALTKWVVPKLIGERTQ